MKVLFDSDGETEEGEAHNYVKVIIKLDGCLERHIKVTHEGIITELVNGGEVLSDLCIEHEEMLPSS